MKVLLLTQWCTPEQAFKSVPFARSLARLGHEVRILTGFPNYPAGKLYPGYRLRLWQQELLEGIPVLRVALYPSHDYSFARRMLNYCSFALSAAVLGPLLLPGFDLVFAYHPPTTVFLPALLLKWLRGVPLLIDNNDVWPHELLHIHGFHRRGIAFRLLDCACRFAYRQAARVNVTSAGRVAILRSQGVPAEKISVILNWCREEALQAALDPAPPRDPRRRFVLLFAGNIGHVQALDAVLEAARRLEARGSGVEIHLVGDGIAKPGLQHAAAEMGLARVRFFPACTQAELAERYRDADALLVHLKPERPLEAAIPSKIFDYLFVGRPILAAVRGSAAELVRAAGAGICCEPGDPEAIAAAIERLTRLSPGALRELGESGRRYYLGELAQERAAGKFSDLFAECRADRGKR